MRRGHPRRARACLVVPRADHEHGGALVRAVDGAAARRRHGRGRTDTEGDRIGPGQSRESADQRRPRLSGIHAERDGVAHWRRDRLERPQDVRLAARRAAGREADSARPPRYTRVTGGNAGAVCEHVRRARAVAHGRHRVDRAPRDGPVRHHGSQFARLRDSRSIREAAHEANGGGVLKRGRTGQGRSGRDRRESAYDGCQGHEAIRVYPDFKPHLVFLDVKMEGMDGLETLKKLRELDPQAQVVMISGHGTIQTAVEATQLGAYDFLEKPLDTDRILLTLRNALQHIVLVSENVRLKQEVRAQYEIVGSSKAIRHVIGLLEKVAPTPARVLITGENGTGKELVARAIHALSRRATGPFIEVNCAAIPTELIESELFGHMKGSFTGAFADRAGKLELADGGTLFLDEIGDMSLSAQAKVLRALQEGVISRVGSGKALPVDVRVIAATNKNLGAEIEQGHFREDLLYRLNVVPIHVPALRERRGDIAPLVAHFSTELTQRGGLPAKEFDAAAIERLTAHDWPGNIRELKNAVERLLILATGATVTQNDVDRLVGKGDGGRGTGTASLRGGDAAWLRAGTFEEFKQAAERAFLVGKLQEHDWNVSETARTLQMPRSNLYKKIERYGLARGGQGSGGGAT
ncbi:MAG: hypothetical protein DMD48_15195 [Gemmatimonadetes bacterium]|nr:MAG: hypothetical protein DMD48_15195 [Gemmatimonadota bacterium]